ncbi:MAG: hypothetical protein K9W44_15160 [Candidatus Lokiarchaeota archaeon]|nr:hypothetical protein [Candidatus Harpocratesius repetitus]
MIIIRYKKKPNILQTLILDFISARTIEIFDMSKPLDYRITRKRFAWIRIKKNKPTQITVTIQKSQKRIKDYIQWILDLEGRCLYRFPRVKMTQFEDFALNHISRIEWDMLHYLPKYQGAFENLFELNDFGYFDEVQERLEL